ncbi:hypothetical protein VTN96DRAFT_2856 [Rasamsonia emersonii]
MAAQVEKARCSDQKGRGEQRSLARERATLLRPAWSHRSWLQGEGSANGEAARGGPRPALRTNHRRRPCWHSTAAPGAEPVLQLAPRGTALRKIRRM